MGSFIVLSTGGPWYDILLHLRSPAAVVSVWGIAGVGKSAHVRYAYYTEILRWKSRSTLYGWVDVPHPFSLAELCRRMLLDFHWDNPQRKEAAAVAMIQGQDPVQGCLDLMRRHQDIGILVLDGLRSKDDWDSIKAAFWSDLPWRRRCKFVVITNQQSVARHCADNNDAHVVNVKGLDTDAALRLFNEKVCACYPARL